MNILKWDTNLKIRLFGEGLFNLLFWMFFPFMAIYFAETLGKVTSGLLLVLSQLISVFANLFGGYLVDRYGRKIIMVWACFGQAISFVFFTLANSPILNSPMLTFISFTTLGIMGSVYWPASRAMVVDIVEESKQAEVFAVFYTAININVVIGPIIGAVFFFDYRFYLLLACTFVTFLLTFIIAKYIRETKPEGVTTKEVSGWKGHLKEQFNNYSIIINDKVFLLFIVAGILLSQTFMQLDLLLPVYIKEIVSNTNISLLGIFSFNISGEKLFGWIISENGLLVVLFTVLVSKVAAFMKDKTVFISSSILYAISMIIFSESYIFWGFIIGMVIFTLGELITVGVNESYVGKISPEHMRGQYFAAASLRYTIGRTIAPLSIPLSAFIGYKFTFIALAIIAVCSAIIYEIMFRIVEKKEKLKRAI
ncbi:MAG: transporter [Bacillales bacterium]|jgi:MFS family permease|nr:transporter [Bacillales bacterium]